MAETLHFTLPQDALHPAFKALNDNLPRTADDADKSDERFRLNIANALWGQEGHPFHEDFIALLNENYGAGLRLLDFVADAEAARQQINTWVSDQTQGRIQDLIPAGAVTEITRLVLTNAVYFKAGWTSKFDPEFTDDETFTLLDGSTVEVPMMVQENTYQYASGDGYEAILLPYQGNRMGMVILLPTADNFAAFEESLDAEQFAAIVGDLDWEKVLLYMPRWENESAFGLGDALVGLGMVDAFDPNAADFSGMADTTNERLFISAVIHKAFVKVDESGTEAAAATAVIMGATAVQEEEPPIELRLDHPFIYAITDQQSGTILFLGRVLNPAG
jgi:serpin B